MSTWSAAMFSRAYCLLGELASRFHWKLVALVLVNHNQRKLLSPNNKLKPRMESYPGHIGARRVFLTLHHPCTPGWRYWFLWRKKNRRTRRKTLGATGENQQQTQPTPGYTGERLALSPLRQSCSLF